MTNGKGSDNNQGLFPGPKAKGHNQRKQEQQMIQCTWSQYVMYT